MKKCKNCNLEFADNSTIFCSECGSRVIYIPDPDAPDSASDSVQDSAPAVTPSPALQQTTQAATPSSAVASSAVSPTTVKPTPKADNGRNKKLLSASIAFMVLAIASGLSYTAYKSGFFASSSSDSSSKTARVYTSSEAVVSDIGRAVVRIDNQLYEGAPLEPQVNVLIKDEPLVYGEDYALSYENNINPGVATVTVTGIGSYSGSISGEFTITVGDTVSDDPSNSGKVDFVISLYSGLLNRLPASSDIIYCVNSLVSGENSASDLIYMIVRSDEFSGLNLSNEDFLHKLYLTVFNREPDESGYQFFLGELNNGADRSSVVDTFVSSEEFSNICASYGV